MRTGLLVTICLLWFAFPALAQDTPTVDVSGGYSFLRDQDVEENFHGWLAAVAGNINPWLGIVGEVGGNYKTLQLFATEVSFSVHSFMFGPRISSRQNQSVTPFFQVLLGAARASGSVFGQSDSTTEFAIQPGGGADFWLRPNVGIRVGGDYRRIVADEGTNEFRFHAGIVLGAGMR
jgi:opacity protein-like surface antigen